MRLKPSRRSVALVSGDSSQRCDRQRRQRFGLLPGRQDRDVVGMKARQRPGRASGVGDRETRRQAETVEPADEIGEQRLFSAEEMRGAGNIEKESVGAILLAPGRDRGRIARRP